MHNASAQTLVVNSCAIYCHTFWWVTDLQNCNHYVQAYFLSRLNYQPCWYYYYCSTSSLYVGTKSSRFNILEAHGKSKRHEHCAVAARGIEAPMPAVLEGLQRWMCVSTSENVIMHAAYYVAKQEVPFTHFSTLYGLINRTGGRLPGSSESDKACARYVAAVVNNMSKISWLNIWGNTALL